MIALLLKIVYKTADNNDNRLDAELKLSLLTNIQNKIIINMILIWKSFGGPLQVPLRIPEWTPDPTLGITVLTYLC